MSRLILLLVLLPMLHDVRADDAVVGNGTPASCTELALDDAIFQVYFGGTQGGRVSFDCGAAPVTIPITLTRILDAGVATEIDGGGLITLDANEQTRHFDISGANTLVTLRGLHLTRGVAPAGTFGGAIRQRDASTLLIEDCRFTDNEGALGGGALGSAIDGSILTVRRSRFEDNLADQGGAIVKASGRFDLVDSDFAGNRAVNAGGAVFWRESFGEILRSRFVDNEANEGGAVWIRGAFADVVASTFDSNRATTFGGALSIDRTIGGASPPVRLIGVTARDNSAGQGGGAFNIRTDSFVNTVGSPTRLINVSTAGNRVLLSTGIGGDVLAQCTSGVGFSNFVTIAYSSLLGGTAQGGGTAIHALRNSRVFVRKSVLGGAAGSTCAASGSNPVVGSEGENFGALASCPFNALASDRDVADLQLSTIGAFGGGIDTYLPLPGSPLIDYATCDDTIATLDARGSPRQVDGDGDLIGRCDVGAVERQPGDVTAVSGLPFADGFESP